MTEKRLEIFKELEEDMRLHGRIAYAIVNEADEYSIIRLDPAAEYHFVDADEHVAFE